jgi:sugar phosphate isomerase/epimerase
MCRRLDIALSTSWLPHLNLPPEDFLRVMGVFGITSFELNYQVHPLDLEFWGHLLERYELTITSLHNICSADGTQLALGNHYGDNLAHPDEETRLQSVRHLRATAEAARYLGARAVVVHAGSHAEHFRNPGYLALLQGLRENASADGLARMRQEVARLATERKATVEPYLRRLVVSLREVVFDFPAIHFGLENRYHYYGLPDVHELRVLIEEVGAENVGLWADLGHGQVQENLGLITTHEAWFERYTDRLVGIHFHGINGLVNDHWAPTADNMDWEMVRRHVRPDTLLVAELSYRTNALGDVIAGLRYLDALLRASPN